MTSHGRAGMSAHLQLPVSDLPAVRFTVEVAA